VQVSDNILPTFNLEGEDAVGLHVPYYSSNPNRLNPRLPGAKRSDHEENELKSLLDESTAGWNAILGDSGRIDLIQPDFPPSAASLYAGNHPLSLQVGESGVAAEPPRLSPMVPAQMPALISNSVISDDGLDQATKSMSKLYVNSELSPKGGASAQTPTQMLNQYHAPLNSAAAPFFQPPKSPVGGTGGNLNGASINSIIGNGDAFGMKSADNNSNSFGAQDGMGINTSNSSGFLSSDANVFAYNPQNAGQNVGANAFGGMLGGKVGNANTASNGNTSGQGSYQVIPPQGTNNVYPQQISGQMPQLMMQQPMTMQGNPQQSQSGFFMQPQQMIMNNGQPVFIRNVNQFSQDYMYNIDGSMQMQSPAAGMMTDPNQMAQQQQQQQQMQFMQQYGNVQNMNVGMQQQFWNGGAPEQGMNPQAPIFVANQNQQSGMRMNMGGVQNVEEPMRIMFNSNVSFGNVANAQAAMAMQQGPSNNNAMNRAVPMNQQQMMSGMQYPMNNPSGNQMMSGVGGSNSGGNINAMMGRMDGMQGMNNYVVGGNGMGPEDGSGMMNNGMMGNNHRNGGYDDYSNNNNNNNNNGMNSGNRDRRDYNSHHGDRNGGGHYRDRHNNVNNHGHHNNNMDGGHMGGRYSRDQNNHNMNNMNNNMGSKDKMNRNNLGNTGGNFHGNHTPRDALVDEFRSSFGKPGKTWTLKELSTHIVAFCQDQHGSRFIQQRLEVCTESEKQLVFDEVLPSAHILMTDVFGNYVLQKLFEYGAEDQCESLAAILKGQAVALSMQMYGCRVVQKALEYVSRDRLVELVKEFEAPQALIECVHDSNGNHVIQKCIEVVNKAARSAESPEMAQYLSGRIQFIIDQFQGRVKELSSHPYGCRVVQRILEHCTSAQKDVILEELRACCGELVQDCYGNYVIQFVMQHGCEADQAILMQNVMDNLLEYSQHKFASNVVEKCLQFASHKDRNDMIWKIINATFDLANPVDNKGHCFLETMVRDPYANYVVQKVIEVSDERQRGAIMRYVKDNITQLRKYTYGKHIIICLEKLTNEKF
jgi:pumilio RNA-binding family